MAMRFKISKAQYDKLSPEFQGEYIAGDKDGEFVLDVSDLPAGEDVGPVKRALESERNAHKATKTALGEANAKIEAFPDVEALKTTHAAEVKKYKDFTENSLVEGEALKLASKISTAPAVLLPHIKSRLIADVSGDKPVTKVLGADGKPTDLTIDKLGEEFVANKDFATIIKASNGSGGGMPPRTAASPLGGGMPPKDGEQNATPDLSKAKPADLAERIKGRLAAKAEAGGGQAQQ